MIILLSLLLPIFLILIFVIISYHLNQTDQKHFSHTSEESNRIDKMLEDGKVTEKEAADLKSSLGIAAFSVTTQKQNSHVSIVGLIHVVYGFIISVASIIFLVFPKILNLYLLDHNIQMIIALPIIFFILIGITHIIAGVFINKSSNIARKVIVTLSVFQLLNLPIGTGIGIYSIWVLMIHKETWKLFDTQPTSSRFFYKANYGFLLILSFISILFTIFIIISNQNVRSADFHGFTIFLSIFIIVFIIGSSIIGLSNSKIHNRKKPIIIILSICAIPYAYIFILYQLGHYPNTPGSQLIKKENGAGYNLITRQIFSPDTQIENSFYRADAHLDHDFYFESITYVSNVILENVKSSSYITVIPKVNKFNFNKSHIIGSGKTKSLYRHNQYKDNLGRWINRDIWFIIERNTKLENSVSIYFDKEAWKKECEKINISMALISMQPYCYSDGPIGTKQ